MSDSQNKYWLLISLIHSLIAVIISQNIKVISFMINKTKMNLTYFGIIGLVFIQICSAKVRITEWYIDW